MVVCFSQILGFILRQELKSNETAKQLPDKCVKALDKYLDNLTKEENQKENDNESK